MARWAHVRGRDDWLRTAPLDGRARDDIAQARNRAGRGQRSVTHGHVVAELNLGFWRYLVSKRYLTSLWIPALQYAFPGHAGNARTVQREVETHVSQLLYLRNRSAHHEPIHRRDLHRDLDMALALVGYVHPAAREWLSATETLSALLLQRPIPRS